MMTRKILAILLACALLFSLAGCQEEPKPVRPDPPSDWDEFLGRIIDPETQTFHLPEGDIWYDTSDELLNYLELTEDEVEIFGDRSEELSSFMIMPPTTSFADTDICYDTYYPFLLDHLEGEIFRFNNLTTADVDAFLESFQALGQQISFDTDEFFPTIDEFVESVKDKTSIDSADLPEEEQQQTKTISWTDENNVHFVVKWSIRFNSETERNQSLEIEIAIDLDTFYEHIGYEPPSRVPFS